MVTKKTKRKTRAQIDVPPVPFHERFEISVGISDARDRFVSRIKNYVFENFFRSAVDDTTLHRVILWQVANSLGYVYQSFFDFDHYVGHDFYRCLQVLEACHKALADPTKKVELSTFISMVLAQSEVDLGIRWERGCFIRSGAALLDQKVVNEPLRWLSTAKFGSVRAPFEKGLSHFIEAEKKPERLADVITDMYEATEALAKLVTGRQTKDLSANAETFIKSLKVSQHYKQLLKDYISYANQFRHAAKDGPTRPTLSTPEVESFIYLTGIFIRLAITST